MNAGADNDSVRVSGGNDTVDAGAGNDFVDLGVGRDSVAGGDGNDTLHAGNLRGAVQDAERNDTLLGGTGFDAVGIDFSNQTGAFSITAGATHSYVFVDGARATDFETVHDFATSPGNFNDLLRLDTASDDGFDNHLRVFAGNDTVHSGKGNDTVDAGTGNDYVNTGSNRVVLQLAGGSLPSVVSGAESFAGGEGNDTISFEQMLNRATHNAGGAVTTWEYGVGINLATGVGSFGAAGVTATGFENVTGTRLADNLVGTDGPNLFQPLSGGGFFSTYLGTRRIQTYSDTVNGGEGDDTLRIDYSGERRQRPRRRGFQPRLQLRQRRQLQSQLPVRTGRHLHIECFR